MGYFNLRKILIILCIVHFVLCIFNKVFASDVITDNTYNVKSYNQNITLPEAFKDNYWFCYISNNTAGFSGFLLKIFYSNKRFNANLVNGSYVISSLENAKVKSYQVSGPSRTLANIQNYVNSLSFDLSNVTATDYSNIILLPNTFNVGGVLASNFTITNDNNEIVINKTNENIINPYFSTTDTEFTNLDFDKVFIETGTYNTSTNLYFKVLEVTNVVTDPNDPSSNIYYFNDLTFTLNNKSQYYHQLLDTSIYYFSIPYNALKLKKDTSYYFLLTNDKTPFVNHQGELTTNENIFDIALTDSSNLITTSDEIINTLTNDNTSDNTDNIITENLPNIETPNDPTISTFNWIYNYFVSVLNTIEEGVPDVYLNITPYGLEGHENFLNFRISPRLTYNALQNYPFILNIIQTTYWFAVSYYIIQNIRKYVEKIKTGDIMTHTDTNIKADML